MSVIIEPIYFWKVYKFFQGNEEICYCGIEQSLEEAELISKLYKHLLPKEHHFSDVQTVHYPGAIDISYLKKLPKEDEAKFEQFKNNYLALSPKGERELQNFIKITKKHSTKESVSLEKLNDFYKGTVSSSKLRSR